MHERSPKFECFFLKKTPWGCQAYQVELHHLVPLNTSDDVLVKIVEKVRGHFMHTGRGSGPTLIKIHGLCVKKVKLYIWEMET